MNKDIQKKILKRVLLFFPTVFLLSLVSFLLIYGSSDRAARAMLIEKLDTYAITQESVRDFQEKKGLVQSAPVLYIRWCRGLFCGDPGKSLVTEQPVADLIAATLPKTLALGVLAMLTEIIVGFGCGFFAADREGGALDKLTNLWGVISMSTPGYWVGLVVLWFCATILKWNFVLGYHGFKSLVIPGVLMGLMASGGLMRAVKSKAQLVLQEGYIEQANAQGLSKYTIYTGHVFKNTLPSVVSVLCMDITGFFGGVIFMEKIFSISGVGALLLSSMQSKDYMVLSTLLFYLCFTVSAINLMGDLYCLYADRRCTSALYTG